MKAALRGGILGFADRLAVRFAVVLAAYWWLGDEGAERDAPETASTRRVWRAPAWWLLGLMQG